MNDVNEEDATDETASPRGAATHTHEGKKLSELWHKFRDRNDAGAKNELTEFYFDIVRANNDNISEILFRAIEENDFYQAGVVGFLEALNSYDPDSGVSFEEFGSLAVRKAILGEIRDLVGGEESTQESGA